MIPAKKRVRPYRPKRPPSKVSKARRMEQVKGDPNFQEGWGFNQAIRHHSAHYFIPSVVGMRVSLCRGSTQAPVFIAPAHDSDRKCGVCQRSLDHRSRLKKARIEGSLRARLDARIASFMADPLLGPRLYGCPTCHSIYEGMAPTLFPCTDGHDPVLVVELARKDTWTRDRTE